MREKFEPYMNEVYIFLVIYPSIKVHVESIFTQLIAAYVFDQ